MRFTTYYWRKTGVRTKDNVQRTKMLINLSLELRLRTKDVIKVMRSKTMRSKTRQTRDEEGRLD